MRYLSVLFLSMLIGACAKPHTWPAASDSSQAPPTTQPAAIAKAPATSPANVRALSVTEFQEMRQRHPEYVVLDVRTPAEWQATGVIPGAKLIDFRAPDFDQRLAALDKNKTYLVYCRTGNRSGQACGKLEALNAPAYNLSGGIVAWQKAKLPTTQPTAAGR